MINEKEIDVLCLQEAIIKSDYLPSIANYIKENSNLKFNVQYELSDSHINIGCRMGIVICSKFEINNSELFMLDNPNLVYLVDDNITYYSHDKGFIISYISGYKIITGHCLPFHIFKKSPLDYIKIFEKADKKFVDDLELKSKFILCGDFNYENVTNLFPNIMKKAKDLIDVPTRKEKQLDHIIVNIEMNILSKEVIENKFDHKLCIVEIEDNI
jgi:exonuclease III